MSCWCWWTSSWCGWLRCGGGRFRCQEEGVSHHHHQYHQHHQHHQHHHNQYHHHHNHHHRSVGRISSRSCVGFHSIGSSISISIGISISISISISLFQHPQIIYQPPNLLVLLLFFTHCRRSFFPLIPVQYSTVQVQVQYSYCPTVTLYRFFFTSNLSYYIPTIILQQQYC